ncbi:MAG: T9SS type A sorting domain-containing protein, partial [Ignavibacteriae bacterium]|nr:T9SS type A sorting domain-containing protein [Ignavibacteriota bacterium]
GNYWGITVVSSGGLTNSPRPNVGNLSNADTSDDGKNVFENNNNGGVIYQLYNNGTQDIFAQNNYWGTNDSVMVEQWIVHRPDSAVFGTVTYSPIMRLTEARVQAESPTGFLLQQNYPNPFNPATRIPFSIQDSGFMSLKVFDVLGRNVATLVNDVRPAGAYTIQWHASGLPSGVYYYRLEAGEFKDVKAMILLR